MGFKSQLERDRLKLQLRRLKRWKKQKFPCFKCKKIIIPECTMLIQGNPYCFNCESAVPDNLPRRRMYLNSDIYENK